MSFTTPFFSIYGFLNLYTYTYTIYHNLTYKTLWKYKVYNYLEMHCRKNVITILNSSLRPPVNRNEHNQQIEKYYFLFKRRNIRRDNIWNCPIKDEPHFCLFFLFLFSFILIERKHFQYYEWNKIYLPWSWI